MPVPFRHGSQQGLVVDLNDSNFQDRRSIKYYSEKSPPRRRDREISVTSVEDVVAGLAHTTVVCGLHF